MGNSEYNTKTDKWKRDKEMGQEGSDGRVILQETPDCVGVPFAVNHAAQMKKKMKENKYLIHRGMYEISHRYSRARWTLPRQRQPHA